MVLFLRIVYKLCKTIYPRDGLFTAWLWQKTLIRGRSFISFSVKLSRWGNCERQKHLPCITSPDKNVCLLEGLSRDEIRDSILHISSNVYWVGCSLCLPHGPTMLEKEIIYCKRFSIHIWLELTGLKIIWYSIKEISVNVMFYCNVSCLSGTVCVDHYMSGNTKFRWNALGIYWVGHFISFEWNYLKCLVLCFIYL